MDPHADLHARIARLCRRADESGATGVADEMDHLLSVGYALALLDDRRICQIDERVVEALVGSDERGADLRALAAEGRAARRAVERLRAELAVMHDRYLALRTG